MDHLQPLPAAGFVADVAKGQKGTALPWPSRGGIYIPLFGLSILEGSRLARRGLSAFQGRRGPLV